MRFSLLVTGLCFSGVSVVQAQAVHVGKPDAKAGEVVYTRRCVMCHSVVPNMTIVGPSLYSEMRGPHAKTAAYVHTTIVNGKGKMPAMSAQLSPQEIADVMAYVRQQ